MIRSAPQSGYALLMVLAMTAIVTIGLYTQLPRAAFEAQREKESLLIDHGEQYKRAVQLYCRKMGRYPAKIEDLDNTQNIRFLRKHYIDPMTGKDEWRLLHMGPAGKLIDSKIESADPNKDQFHQGSITEFKAPASFSDAGGPEGVNIATRHRPSDDLTLAPINGNPPPTNSNIAPLAMNTDPSAPGGAPGTPGAPTVPTAPQTPAWVNGGALPGMPAGQRNTVAPTGPSGAPVADPNAGSSISGNGGYGSTGNSGFGSISGNGGYGSSSPTPSSTPPPAGGYPVNSQYQGQSPYPTAPGSNQPNNGGFGQPGQQTSPASMINSLLTSPRPGGAPGTALPGMGGSVVGGLAGVASTHKGHGIRRYADQDEYQKWEFYYDFGKEMSGQGTAPTAPVPQSNPNASTFGGSGGFSGSSAPTPPPAPPAPPSQ